MLMIEAHNQEAALGMHSYELAMNHLGDMVSLHWHILSHVIPHFTISVQQYLNPAEPSRGPGRRTIRCFYLIIILTLKQRHNLIVWRLMSGDVPRHIFRATIWATCMSDNCNQLTAKRVVSIDRHQFLKTSLVSTTSVTRSSCCGSDTRAQASSTCRDNWSVDWLSKSPVFPAAPRYQRFIFPSAVLAFSSCHLCRPLRWKQSRGYLSLNQLQSVTCVTFWVMTDACCVQDAVKSFSLKMEADTRHKMQRASTTAHVWWWKHHISG